MNKSKTEIKDIYEGEILQVWEDKDWVYISFPFCVVNFPKSEWEKIKKELLNIGEL